MSLLFNSSTKYLRRTANLPDPRNFSICGWAYRNAAAIGTTQALFDLEADGSNYLAYAFAPSTNDLTVYMGSTAGGNNTATVTTITATKWYFWALSSSGSNNNQIRAYVYSAAGMSVANVTPGSIPNGVFAAPAANFTVGNAMAGEYLNGALAHVCVWDAVLTQAEFVREMRSAWPMRYTNLNTAFLGRDTTVTDISGNARNWTNGGTTGLTSDQPLYPVRAMRQRGQLVAAAAAVDRLPASLIVTVAPSRASFF